MDEQKVFIQRKCDMCGRKRTVSVRKVDFDDKSKTPFLVCKRCVIRIKQLLSENITNASAGTESEERTNG